MGAEPTKPQSVIAIGASAGGLEALKSLLERFCYDHASVVILTHLSADFDSQLALILQKHTLLEMHKVVGRTEISVNHAYVLGEGVQLTIDETELQVHPFESPGRRRTIDRFLLTLAETWGARAIAVILSGSGSDGTAGLEAVQKNGGITFVQDPYTAEFDEMPRHAKPFADFCLSPKAIGDEITRQLSKVPA
jgi:two-component system CheB/CheR fusion protein